MKTVRWREQFETGLEPIDTQHRQLFEGLDRLAKTIQSEAPGRQLDQELSSIAQHLIKHCQTEETLMKEAGFPSRVLHANQHQEVVLQVRDIQYRHAKGQPVGLEAVSFLGEWLDHHICESDLVMAARLKEVHAV